MTSPTTPSRGPTTARTSASTDRSITRTPMASSSTCRMTRRSPGPRPGGTVYLGDALPDRFRGAFLCCDFLQHSASWWRMARTGLDVQGGLRRQAARQPGHLVLRPRPVPGARRLRHRLRLPRPAHRPPRPRGQAGIGATAASTAWPRRARPRSAALTSDARPAASWSSCCGIRTAGTPSRPAPSSPPAATGAPGRH